jgi:hypothetical protein
VERAAEERDPLAHADEAAAAVGRHGADAVVGDLRGDVEWAVEGCDAAVFAAGARHRAELGAVDAGGAAKLAEAADRFDLSRFVLCSVVGADHPERRQGGVREFLAAKQHAERRLAQLEVPWTILRFGRLTEERGDGRITTGLVDGAALTLSRDDAALAVVESLRRGHLVGLAINIVDGDRAVGPALDAVVPLPLPAPDEPESDGRRVPLGLAQSDNPPDDPAMIIPGAAPLDADVEWVGDGPVPPAPPEG